MKSSNDFNAFILAGGKSSRMGTDKGLLTFRGQPMVQHVIDKLKQVFESITIISNSPDYTKFGLPVLEDEIKSVGPIGGIYSGLKQSATSWNFFVACDMPFLTSNVLDKILQVEIKSELCVVARYSDQLQPLCACYSKSCLPVIAKQIAVGNYKLHDLLKLLPLKEIDLTSISNNPFRNLNTMEEVRLSEYYEN